ncbi:splicing factor Cactin-like [Oscarella lobularis]|uniref:splicing factor Cactin-like n=1 Tax=Oscarella lobularis TaxID=121494 RepID=UPI003313A598
MYHDILFMYLRYHVCTGLRESASLLREMGKKKRDRSRSRSRSPSERKRRRDSSRERRRDRKRKEKETTKAKETAEEKYARRLAKKETKEKKRLEAMGLTKEYLGTDNPFGDANILQPFVWHKKREREGYLNLSSREHEERDKSRMLENRRELEKVKRRREEREKERIARQQELELLQRVKEAEQFKEWEQQEDEFHLEQAKLRSKVRLLDGRAKPIDRLAKYIETEEDDFGVDVELKEPHAVLQGLSIDDLEDLVEDIQVYIGLDQSKNLEFWKDMAVISENELHKLKRAEASLSAGDGFDRRGGIHKAVGEDVHKLFDGKTHNELLDLKSHIMKRIRSGDAVDIGYWETLLQELKAHISKARLKESHQELLRRKLVHLRHQSAAETKEPKSGDSEEDSGDDEKSRAGPSWEMEQQSERKEAKTAKPDDKEEEISEEDLLAQCDLAYEEGNYSPKPINYEDIDESVTLLVNPEEDQYQLEIAKQQYLGQQTDVLATDSDRQCLIEAQRGEIEEGETTFNVQVQLDQKTYLWQDKYRPRKPRFFNRVHTGYEWNKYNQTHYDADNPPPKIVQGYKFNIFYPDLIHKKETPQFFLEKHSGGAEFLILRFHAGPPYEDIAFKIVNREWDYSHQHGFRCQYNQGIFQLWFRFKRYRYRR